MKTRRITAILLIACLLIAAAMPVQAAPGKQALPLSAGIEALRGQFESGCGPEAGGYAIDYSYYAPAEKGDTQKYPLVIWLHGMMQGGEPGQPVKNNDFAYWSSAEFQKRFTGAGGAYLFVPRSHEEQYLYWNDSMIVPLKAAIDDFIAQHRDTIDTTRIYIGGFSMGGKMTLKMTIAYPSFFAAAFPICPAFFKPTKRQMHFIKDIPMWFVASKYDAIAGYYSFVEYEWEYLTAVTSRPADDRLSVLGTVKNPDGTQAESDHAAWVAVTYDMFTYDNGGYYNMETRDGCGCPIALTHPEGMISWLSQFASNYDGTPSQGSGSYRVRSLCEELGRLICMIPEILRTLIQIELDRIGVI